VAIAEEGSQLPEQIREGQKSTTPSSNMPLQLTRACQLSVDVQWAGPGSGTIDHHVTALAAERQGVRQSISLTRMQNRSAGHALMGEWDMRNLPHFSQELDWRSYRSWLAKHTLVLVLMVGAGCKSDVPHSISTSGFQRGCSVDSDCIPVYEGTLTCCRTFECPNAAISLVDYTKYETTAASRRPTCEGVPCLAITITCKSAAVCSDGMCMYHQPGRDASSPD
jgi:hypothetical protein